VARGAGAYAATGVVKENVVVLRYVEERHGLAVMIPGHRAELKLDGAALGKKSDAHELVCGNIFFGCVAHRSRAPRAHSLTCRYAAI